jgi:hypothetical protein
MGEDYSMAEASEIILTIGRHHMEIGKRSGLTGTALEPLNFQPIAERHQAFCSMLSIMTILLNAFHRDYPVSAFTRISARPFYTSITTWRPAAMIRSLCVALDQVELSYDNPGELRQWDYKN